MTLFSIVMPTFNRPRFIRRSVQAILAQTYGDLELIVKDGGEPIFELLPRDSRLIYVHCADRGIPHAVNQAIALAEGSILHWANDDDIMRQGTLVFVSKWLGRSAWGFAKMDVVDVAGRRISSAGGRGTPWNTAANIESNGVPQPSCFWQRWAGQCVGLFDESVGVCCDGDYWNRLGAIWPPTVSNRVMADYTQHPESFSVRNQAGIRASAQLIRQKYGKGS